jgi:hypothetical protein
LLFYKTLQERVKQVANVVIYYKKERDESTEQAVHLVNSLIQQLEIHHAIKGVFMDLPNESTELMELLNSPIYEIDYIYMNKEVEDEFDRQLISQLLNREKFEIRYFSEAQ